MSTGFIVPQEQKSATQENMRNPMVPSDSYTPHEPIIIHSNADFSNQGWPGDGSKANPYIIEGLHITADENCIEIKYTSVFFEVRNCVISSTVASSSSGIYLASLMYGTVRNCTIDSYHRAGINLWYANNCTLINNTASFNVQSGFEIHSSNDCILSNNTAFSYRFGIYLWSSENCVITNNTIDRGILIRGNSVSMWLHEISGNMVNDKPLGYFMNLTNCTIDCSQYAQVILAGCTEVTIEDCIFRDISRGIQLGFCTDCVLMNNTALGVMDGFCLEYSDYCTLVNNNASGIRWGFHLEDSDYCTLVNNTASEVGTGFCLESSYSCTLTNNTASCCTYGGFSLSYSSSCTLTNNTASWIVDEGFHISQSSGCTLTSNIASWNVIGFHISHSSSCSLVGNIAANNSVYGILVSYLSRFNIIYLNRMGDNEGSNARDIGTDNVWDDGISTGNYWTDYCGEGTYQIDEGSVDNFPRIWYTTFPGLCHPRDKLYFVGETGNWLIWKPYDISHMNYSIYKDGDQIKSGMWNSSTDVIAVSIDGLEIGIYNYTIVVTNMYEISANDTVFVSVVIAPVTTTTTTTGNTTTTRTDEIPEMVSILVISSVGFSMIVISIVAIWRKRNL